MTLTRTCTRCGEEKPLSEFHKDKYNKLGVRTRCKKCVLEDVTNYGQMTEWRSWKNWRKKNPEKTKAMDKANAARWKKENPEKFAAIQKKALGKKLSEETARILCRQEGRDDPEALTPEFIRKQVESLKRMRAT